LAAITAMKDMQKTESNPQENSVHSIDPADKDFVEPGDIAVIVEAQEAEENDDEEAKDDNQKQDNGTRLKHPDDNDEIEYRSCFRHTKYTKKELRLWLEQKQTTLFQFDRLVQIIMVIAGFVVLLLLRGAGDTLSIVGIKRCDPLDWTLLGILIIFQIGMTFVAMAVDKRVYELKKSVNWEFFPGDY